MPNSNFNNADILTLLDFVMKFFNFFSDWSIRVLLISHIKITKTKSSYFRAVDKIYNTFTVHIVIFFTNPHLKTVNLKKKHVYFEKLFTLILKISIITNIFFPPVRQFMNAAPKKIGLF